MRLLLRLLVLWVGFSVSVDSRSEKNRVKRVWNGLPIRDRFYPSVRYFAAIGTVHSRRFPLGWANSEFGSWSDGHIMCGGALITTGIVQTACHCLATFETETGFIRKFVKLKAFLMNVWEAAYVVYVGRNEERENLAGTWGMTEYNYIGTKKFVIHQSCAQLGSLNQKTNTYDLGWIGIDHFRLLENEGGRIPIKDIDFAPTYTLKGLWDAWNYTVLSGRSPVCLHVGFGRDHNGEIPQRMMHGWGVVLDRLSCRNYTTFRVPEEEVDSIFTWFCSYQFPKHIQRSASGDSGGPVACDGHYVGVLHGSSYHEVKVAGEWIKEYFTVHTGIYFAMVQNSYEYRIAFIAAMRDVIPVWCQKSITIRPPENHALSRIRRFSHLQPTS